MHGMASPQPRNRPKTPAPGENKRRSSSSKDGFDLTHDNNHASDSAVLDSNSHAIAGADVASTSQPGKQYALAIEMRRIFTRLEILGYAEYHQQSIKGRPISQQYFAERNPGGDPFMAFARLAVWLIRKCGRTDVLAEPEDTDDPNEISYNIVEQCKKLNIELAFKPYKLKTGHGEEVVNILSALTDRAMQVAVQLALPIYPSATMTTSTLDDGTDDETVEEISIGPLLGGYEKSDVDVESSDEEDEGAAGDYARIGIGGGPVSTTTQDTITTTSTGQQNVTGSMQFGLPSSAGGESSREAQALADMQMPAMSDDDWRAEVERVQHKLKVVIRPDNRDWRSHVEQLTTLTKEIGTLGKDTSDQLNKLAGEIGKTYDKLTSREKYVNKQLNELTSKFRSSRQRLKELRDKGREGRKGIEDKLEKINRYDDQLDEIKRKIEEKTTEMTDRNSITALKVAMKRLKEEINLMEIRTAVIDQVILRNRWTMRNNSNSMLTMTMSGDNMLFDSNVIGGAATAAAMA